MTINFSNRLAQMMVTMALLTSGTSALALSTWNLDSGCPSSGSGTALTSTNCGAGLNLSGWSTSNGTASTSGTTFASAAVYDWGSYGLGVVNAYEIASNVGPHATDNVYGTDAILLSFSSAVNLTNVKVGWTGTTNTGTDSDFSVLAYTGSGTGAVGGTTLTGTASTSTLLTSGWQVVGNYGNSVDNANVAISSQLYSHYWLVSAYNSAFGTGTTLNVGNDYFKLLSVAGNTQNVPEPGSLVLLGVGLIGVVASRRQKTKLA
jgi:hypothetical protein